jgi:hypothetical protein
MAAPFSCASHFLGGLSRTQSRPQQAETDLSGSSVLQRAIPRVLPFPPSSSGISLCNGTGAWTPGQEDALQQTSVHCPAQRTCGSAGDRGPEQTVAAIQDGHQDLLSSPGLPSLPATGGWMHRCEQGVPAHEELHPGVQCRHMWKGQVQMDGQSAAIDWQGSLPASPMTTG